MPPRSPSVVSIARVGSSIRAAVHEAMELAGFADAVPQGSPVVVKPNLGWDLFLPGSVTSPAVLDAVLEVVAARAGKLWVAESAQVLENVERVRRKMGLDDIFRKHGAEWVDITHAPRTPVAVPGARVLREVLVPQPFDRALLVTVPVLKTHDKTLLSCAIKNQWGCIPVIRHSYHLVVNDALIDLLRALPPRFAVVDGTVALEGNGPKSGWPKVMDLVLASADPVAVDWVCGQVMGFGDDEVQHVREAARAGLGNAGAASVVVRGARVEDVRQPFRRPRSNLVSRVEMNLRRSTVRRLVFDTPLFSLMLVGAKLWYYAWHYAGGRHRAAPILSHPLYGPVWECLRPGRRRVPEATAHGEAEGT